MDTEDAQRPQQRCPACAAEAACLDVQGDYARFERLAAAWRAVGGPDLSTPATARAGDAALFPCLPRVLSLRAGFAVRAPDAPREVALAWSEAAFAVAPPGSALAAQARADMAAAARALAPEIGAELLAGMAAPGLPPGTPDELAALFVQTLVQGRSYEAAHLEALVEVEGLPPPLAADVLFCQGVLALNLHQQPARALALFERDVALCAAHPHLAGHAAVAREHAALARARLAAATAMEP